MKPRSAERPLLACYFTLQTGDGLSPGKGLQAQNMIAREDEQKIKEGRPTWKSFPVSRAAPRLAVQKRTSRRLGIGAVPLDFPPADFWSAPLKVCSEA